MENVWGLFNTHTDSSGTISVASSSVGGQNDHSNSWETWDLGNTRHDWSHSQGRNQQSFPHLDPGSAAAHAHVHANQLNEAQNQHHSLYPRGSHYYRHPDPHLACLNLGKRHYFEDTTLTNERHMDEKRGRPVMGGVGVPMCQVDGCHVSLMDVKEYHRRHKVCELHSKASRVVVLGVEQRFCQQCSRFHAMSEFDDSKRSCRRRLAGHNERRRKGSYENAINLKNSSQAHALSLLSSTNDTWQSSSADLSTRGSAALHELIAEHRASNFSRKIVLDRNWSTNQYNQSQDNTNISSYHSEICEEPQLWDLYNEGPNGHVTLDLMQARNSAFCLFSMKENSQEQEEGCSELVWRSLRGSHDM